MQKRKDKLIDYHRLSINDRAASNQAPGYPSDKLIRFLGLFSEPFSENVKFWIQTLENQLISSKADKKFFVFFLKFSTYIPDLAKQVFSALNAQLMAELPKLSSLAESLLLSSVASVSFLIGQLMKKINALGPAPSTSNTQIATKTFKTANHQIWKSQGKFFCVWFHLRYFRKSWNIFLEVFCV